MGLALDGTMLCLRDGMSAVVLMDGIGHPMVDYKDRRNTPYDE
jgi:hypothetical protein